MKEAIKTIRKIGQEFMNLADQLEGAEETQAEEAAPVAEASPAPKDTGDESAIKMEDVRAVLAEISREGKTDEMKALLKKFGASKLSDVNPKDYAAILAEAEEIKNA